MSETHKATTTTEAEGQPPAKLIHRVCIQCNNMFTVTPDKIDEKHCPSCHKG